jgi:hypothetical protein
MKNKNYQFPKIKKNLKTFLTEEEGKIAKKSIKKIGLGLIMAGIAVSGLMRADKTLGQTCSHTSHASHASHASHSSHGSHGSHGSHTSW